MGEALVTEDLDMLDGVIRAYFQRHPTGGSLHIVLDEGDWGRGSIRFCLERAQGKGDLIGAAIAAMLLEAPDRVLEECDRLGWVFGLNLWIDLLAKEER